MGKIAKVVDVSGCSNIDQVLAESGTDWTPALLRPTTGIFRGETGSYFDSDEVNIRPGSFQAVTNPVSGDVLGFVRGKYRTQSHVDQVRQLDTLVCNGDLLPTTVSVWDNGALIAYQFQSPTLDAFPIAGDRVSPLLTLAFFHDGKGSDMAFFSDFRWFCKNQLGKVADANGGHDKARHFGDNRGLYSDILMGRIASLKTELGPRYKAMSAMQSKPLKGRELLGYFGQSLGMKDTDKIVSELWSAPEKAKGDAKTLKAVLESYREDPAGAPGSVWHAFNGITRYVTHGQGRNPATRSARALIGQGQAVIARSFTLAAAMAA